MSRAEPRGARSNYWRNGLLFVALIALVSAPSLSRLGFGQEQAQELTELEALKGEVLQLRYDSIDKQMRLMQAQYQQLQAQQAEIIGQLQALEKGILQAHGLSATAPGEWSVNWQTKAAEPHAPASGQESEEKRIQKSGVRSQESEGEQK